MDIQSIISLPDNHCKNQDILSVSITTFAVNSISPMKIRFITDPLISSITLCPDVSQIILLSIPLKIKMYIEICHHWNDGWYEYPQILSCFMLFIFVSLTILNFIVKEFEDWNSWKFDEISFVYYLIEERRSADKEHFYLNSYLLRVNVRLKTDWTDWHIMQLVIKKNIDRILWCECEMCISWFVEYDDVCDELSICWEQVHDNLSIRWYMIDDHLS